VIIPKKLLNAKILSNDWGNVRFAPGAPAGKGPRGSRVSRMRANRWRRALAASGRQALAAKGFPGAVLIETVFYICKHLFGLGGAPGAWWLHFDFCGIAVGNRFWRVGKRVSYKRRTIG